jgi:hypothetical protein
MPRRSCRQCLRELFLHIRANLIQRAQHHVVRYPDKRQRDIGRRGDVGIDVLIGQKIGHSFGREIMVATFELPHAVGRRRLTEEAIQGCERRAYGLRQRAAVDVQA